MKKATLVVLLCWLCIGGAVEKEIAGDELQPGPFDIQSTNEVIL